MPDIQTMTLKEITVIFILSFWLLANASYAIFNKKLARVTFYADVFKWVSAFQLFSYNNLGEYKLYYRDRLSDHSVTEWKNIPLTPRWKIYHAIWFPQNAIPESIKSIVSDFATIVKTQQDKTKLKKMNERFNYNAILCFIMQIPSGEFEAGRQFRVVDQENLEVFTSYFHKG